MVKRKAIGKKLRFEVFKRDGFKCQYCGKSAPDVVLHVDHVNPVSKGGGADILNLITSCQDCNLGKGARELSDDSVLQKQKQQLEELNEKRQQLEMMLKWRKEITNLAEIQLGEVVNLFSVLTGNGVTDYGKGEIKRWLKKYSLEEILESLEISASQYLVDSEDGDFDSKSIDKTFDYIPRICAVRKSTKEKPYLAELFKLKWLVKNELHNIKEYEIMKVLEEAHLSGFSVEDLRYIIKASGSWRTFKDALTEASGVYYG